MNSSLDSENPCPISSAVLDCVEGGEKLCGEFATCTDIEEIAMESLAKNGHSAGRRRTPIAPRTGDPHALTPTMRIALRLLLQAHEIASRLHRDPWDFALEIQALKEAGVNHNDLRSLVCQGLSQHRLERTRRGARRRSFGPPRSLRFHADSCFALSRKGLLVAYSVDGSPLSSRVGNGSHAAAMCIPSWDDARRELRLGSIVVKRFRQPAPNQATILAAFEEDGWPPRIDNPLSDHGDTGAVDRLHAAVKKLNRCTRRLLRFLSDGAGLGILWELAGEPGAVQERTLT